MQDYFPGGLTAFLESWNDMERLINVVGRFCKTKTIPDILVVARAWVPYIGNWYSSGLEPEGCRPNGLNHFVSVICVWCKRRPWNVFTPSHHFEKGLTFDWDTHTHTHTHACTHTHTHTHTHTIMSMLPTVVSQLNAHGWSTIIYDYSVSQTLH